MRSFATVALAAVATFLLLGLPAHAQDQACQNKAVALQSSCSAFQTSVKQNKNLIGASNDDLKKAISSSNQKPDANCCKAIAAFATPSATTCACDKTVDTLAQAQGISSDGLLTLIRVAAIGCEPLKVSISAPSQNQKCPATAG